MPISEKDLYSADWGLDSLEVYFTDDFTGLAQLLIVSDLGKLAFWVEFDADEFTVKNNAIFGCESFIPPWESFNQNTLQTLVNTTRSVWEPKLMHRISLGDE